MAQHRTEIKKAIKNPDPNRFYFFDKKGNAMSVARKNPVRKKGGKRR